MRRGVVIIVGALLALAAAGCGSSSSSSSGGGGGSTGSSGGGQKTVAGVKANDHGTKLVSKEAEVELDDYYFQPTVIQGKAGQKVTLELKNEGKVEHSFTLDAQGIDKTLGPGEDAKVTVTIPPSGAVSFYCKFHKSSGMAGALAVQGQGAGGSMPGGGTTTDNTTTGKGYGY
jgi:plastocyanin